ncbi:MAG: hypothetical protein ABSF60_14445 [Verrucomicrobiota bacterium]
MNQIAPPSARLRRTRVVLVICMGIVFGAVCFFAGRLSVLLMASGSDSNTANKAGHLPASAINAAILSSASNTQSNPASKASSGWDEQEWSKLKSQPGTMARNAAMAKMLEMLAATDPKRAMALAQAEGNRKFRADLEQAALRGWAGTAPVDASNWALALTNPNDRDAAMKTVLASAAAADPDEAVRVAKLIMQQDPSAGGGYGSSLVDALCNAGNFETAAKFAADGDNGQRPFWLGETYSKWAELQPEQAAADAMTITDPNIRNQALHGIVGGWAQADPAALTQFLAQLPAGGDRCSLIGQAIQQWVRLDPVAAADWIDNSDLGPDLDQGIKAVANMDLFAGDIQPDVAVNWAESITDPTVRSQALLKLLRDWVLMDLPAAKSYLETTTNLLPADRQKINQVIENISRNAAQ